MYSTGIAELYSSRGVVPAKKYRIEPTEEQQELKALVSPRRHDPCTSSPPRWLSRGKTGGLTDLQVRPRASQIARKWNGYACVNRSGEKEQQRRRPKKLAAEAHLIALASGEPPQGRVSWTPWPVGGVPSTQDEVAQPHRGQKRTPSLG